MKKHLILSLLLPMLCGCSNYFGRLWGEPEEPVYLSESAYTAPNAHRREANIRATRANITEPPSRKSYYRKSKPISQFSYQAAQEYVNRVGQKIALVSDEERTLRFVVTNDLNPSIYRNDNTILISRGMLVQLNNEAELAAVLSEIISKKTKKPRYGIGYKFKKAKTERSQENKKALDYMHRAGYDPKASVSATKKLDPNADTSEKEQISDTFPTGQATGTKKYQKMLRSINAQTQKEIRARAQARQKTKPKSQIYYPESVPMEAEKP